MEVLGIDVGGSGIKAALVNTESGELITKRKRFKTPHPSTPEAVIKVITKLIKRSDYHGPVGVGFPSIILDGTITSAANIDDGWIGFRGQEKMSEATGYPVTLINDADSAGIAEMRFGAGRGQSGLVMILTLGTGIGSALFVDGTLVPNTEFGHLYLQGHTKDAEDFTSDRIRTEEKLKWTEWAGRLDIYLSHLEFIFSPNLIILGGGVSKFHRKFVPKLTLRTRVVPARLLNEAGIIGAAMAAAEAQPG